jgi:hypothetical protein
MAARALEALILGIDAQHKLLLRPSIASIRISGMTVLQDGDQAAALGRLDTVSYQRFSAV